MIEIKNENIKIQINEENGLITELVSSLGNINIADSNGFGSICYTLKDDSLETNVDFSPYKEKESLYQVVYKDFNKVICCNSILGITTTYELNEDSLIIKSDSCKNMISEFGVNLNFNFLGKKANGYTGQLLPSSPYTSDDGKKMYCIMPMINRGFCIAAAKTICDGWKIDYSSYSAGHFIQNFKFLSSFDKKYNGSHRTSIIIEIAFEETIKDCYERLSKIYHCPMAYAEVTGTFDRKLSVQLIGNVDFVGLKFLENPNGIRVLRLKNGEQQIEIEAEQYGLCSIIPYGKKRGLDTTVWFGKNINELFTKSCESINKPYHNDCNLCEGMVWLWSLLCNMSFYHHTEYMKKVLNTLEIILSETNNPIDRLSILPYGENGYPAYHIKNSNRIQEEFFGISILTESYKVTGKFQYIDFAYFSAEAMINTYQQHNGALVCQNGDYTTVCAPIIALIDLAMVYKEIDDKRSRFLINASEKMVNFLLQRGFHFPTEGDLNDLSDEEMEEGSIACTALVVLYYCYFIQPNQRFIDFAAKVLKLHDWWRSYTPDVRLYLSTMRWWETIWEGDGTGPAICGGHAWSIWRAEADYYMGMLTYDAEYMLKSWNGFLTNFSKIQSDGSSYACYQPDYITGGGLENIRKGLQQLQNEDIKKKYEITHGYPKHKDNSLSRYVWVRASNTWLKTAAVILKDEMIIPINCVIKEEKIEISDEIEMLFVAGLKNEFKVCTENKLKLVSNDARIISFEGFYYIVPLSQN